MVEGDLFISSEEELRAYYEGEQIGIEPSVASTRSSLTVETSDNGVDALWSASQAQNLRYCVSREFGADHAPVVSEMDLADGRMDGGEALRIGSAARRRESRRHRRAHRLHLARMCWRSHVRGSGALGLGALAVAALAGCGTSAPAADVRAVRVAVVEVVPTSVRERHLVRGPARRGEGAADPPSLEVDVELPEELPSFPASAEVPVRLRERVWVGRVQRVDASQAPHRLHLTLDDDGLPLSDGVEVEVELLGPERSVIRVPLAAILDPSGGRPFVYTVDAQDRAARAWVTLGALDDGLVEVREGLEAGQRVITRGHARLLEGDPLEVEEGGDAS